MKKRDWLIHNRISILAEMPNRIKLMPFDFMNKYGVCPSRFTCNFCEYKMCEWAYDIYNTDGDCLATK
jgi:hypothetical protein